MAEAPVTRLAPLSLPPLTESRLDNGLTVVAAERARSPLASVCLVFKAGSARDPKGKAGLADFTVELLRRGTLRHPAQAIDEALELMGADLRLETSADSTVISATVPIEHLEPTLALMSELVREPAFAAREVLSARKRTLALLATDLDDPAMLAAGALYRVALGSHPYGHLGRGVRREVATFSRADCVAWRQRWIRPEDASIIIVSDAPGKQAADLVRGLFGAWAGRSGNEKPLPPVPAIVGHPILLVDKAESNQAQIRIAANGPGRLYEQIIAARLSALILGGGFTSRLVDSIRVTRGLSYGVGSYLTESEAGGLFVVSSYTKTATVRELIDVALEQARGYRQGGPTAEELTRAQRYTNGLYPLSLETVDQLARALAETRRFGRGRDWLERYRERVAATGAEEVAAQARQFFLGGAWAAAVVGEAKELLPMLEGLGKVQVIPAQKLG
jgi:zinc protease